MRKDSLGPQFRGTVHHFSEVPMVGVWAVDHTEPIVEQKEAPSSGSLCSVSFSLLHPAKNSMSGNDADNF